MAIIPKDDIQIILPSNTKTLLYPNNNASSYVVELNAPVQLEGEWEVAIIDIRYPPFHKNISYELPVVYVIHPPSANFFKDNPLADYPLDEMTKEDSRWGVAARYVKEIIENDEYKIFSDGAKYRVAYIESGHSKSSKYAGSIFETLFYKAFSDWNPVSQRQKFKDGDQIGIQFTLDKTSAMCSFKILGMNVSILTVPQLLGRVLNFEFKTFTKTSHQNPLVWFQHKHLTGPAFPMSENFSLISAMYVYSDLTEYQIVGDAQVPIVGIVPIQPEEKVLPYWSFNPPYYFTVKKKHFKTVEIQLNTDTGIRFPFIGSGTTEVRLHFRKKQRLF